MAAVGILVTGISGLGSLAFLILAAIGTENPPPPNSISLPMSFWLKIVVDVGAVPFVTGLTLVFAGLAVIRRTE